MKKFVSVEIDLIFFKKEDIVRTSPFGGTTLPGDEDFEWDWVDNGEENVGLF